MSPLHAAVLVLDLIGAVDRATGRHLERAATSLLSYALKKAKLIADEHPDSEAPTDGKPGSRSRG